MEFLQGRIDAAEAISRTTLENALAWLLEQEMVVERDRKLVLGPAAERPEQRDAFRTRGPGIPRPLAPHGCARSASSLRATWSFETSPW